MPDVFLQMLRESRKPHVAIPDGVSVTPFAATNATAVAAAATPQAVRAATASKRKWITQASAINPTTGEDAILNIQDDADVLYFRLPATNLAEAPAQPMAGLVYTFDPPILIPAGKAIEVSCVGNIGDSYLSVAGYEED